MIVDPLDWDDISNHHPTCPNGCGQLADECMCNWFPKKTYLDYDDEVELHPEDFEYIPYES